MTQYAVVVRPDTTQNVILIGPFRNKPKAENIRARIDRLDEELSPEGELRADGGAPP